MVQVVEGVGVDVKAVMDTWTRQPGFPVVDVGVIGRQVKLRQRRFLLYRPANDTSSTTSHSKCVSLILHQLMIFTARSCDVIYVIYGPVSVCLSHVIFEV